MLELSDFQNYKTSKDGKHFWCKECKNIYDKRPAAKEYKKAYNARPEVKARKKEYDKNRIDYDLKRLYGITFKEKTKLLEQQNYKCKICEAPENNAGKYGLVVDHNHLNNKIRGLLCNNCNTALGLFRENCSVLEKAIQYLKNQ